MEKSYPQYLVTQEREIKIRKKEDGNQNKIQQVLGSTSGNTD